MKRLFLAIYSFLSAHKVLLWTSIVVSTFLMVWAATGIRVDENISSFFPRDDKQVANGVSTDFVMKNIKAMDQIVVAIDTINVCSDGSHDVFEAAEAYADTLRSLIGEVADVSLYYDEETENELISYAYSHVPFLLDDDDYASIDSLLSPEAIAAKMASNREMMLSPLSTGLSRLMPLDPLGLFYPALQRLESVKPSSDIYMEDGYMMSNGRLIMFVSLHDDFGQTGDNASAVGMIRSAAQDVANKYGVNVWAYGAPIVAVSNSSQVKSDETVTVSIALLVTAIVIFLAFRRKRAVPLVILPVVYGALFAFAVVAALGVELSLISIGTGAMVLGLAMSYSIHMLTHSLHSTSIEALIEDMAYPMTVGSITTIGAFVGLMFTDSKILQDLGLFASLALVGTLLSSIIILPHFLSADASSGKSATFSFIERIAGYDYAGNRIIVACIAILTVVGLFFFTDVKFNSDMNSLNYDGDKWISDSREIVECSLTPNDTSHHATLVVTGLTPDELGANGEALYMKASQLNEVRSVSSLTPWFVQSDASLNRRLLRWQNFWTEDRKVKVAEMVRSEAQRNGFSPSAFELFADVIGRDYSEVDANGDALCNPTCADYISRKDSVLMLYVNMTMDNMTKDETMDCLALCEGTVVTDMGYFVRKAASSLVDNFNFILLVSSALVGLVLLLSYRRIELFAMTFLPMCISWVIILGLMALFGIEFNVVNIILSTFIFGVGDDFSIFIMDGLLSRYKGEKDLLGSHKTAIALSGFAVMIGLGVQVFAEHPACKSIGYLSIFGLVAVIVTSYVVQPILFRTFISDPAKVDQPYTLLTVLRSIFFYGMFVVGCIIGYVALGLLVILPMPTRWKKCAAHYVVYGFMHFFYSMFAIIFSMTRIGKIDFSRPSIIIANHQSLIDIINMLSLSPRVVCITKSWVVNSPLFGPLTRYCDFYNADEGSAEMIEKMRRCVADGYSIVIFPEGTRSEDGQIHRFHKGAFMLAQQLEVELSPMVIYGNSMIASKRQPLNVKTGRIVNKVLPRIKPVGDCHALAKDTCALFRKEYEEIKAVYDGDDNPHYREAILHHYVYKDMDEYYRVRKAIKDAEILHAERVKLGL
ncbi:MAG: 1-acyl-sn-glycerol-3-phosphate acyltransferase [Bacteroidales bacterium]|nr:1-acyl-sn-glycerol-3-phosphate acyltransferase [Bacteroidales bacterium]